MEGAPSTHKKSIKRFLNATKTKGCVFASIFNLAAQGKTLHLPFLLLQKLAITKHPPFQEDKHSPTLGLNLEYDTKARQH